MWGFEREERTSIRKQPHNALVTLNLPQLYLILIVLVEWFMYSKMKWAQMQGVKNGVFFSIPVLMHGGLLYLVFCLSVCLSVCLSLLRLHYTPLQRYMGYLCTMRAQYAPPRRSMHHGAQGRLYFLKNYVKYETFGVTYFRFLTVYMYTQSSTVVN